jgi:hypothetical protein
MRPPPTNAIPRRQSGQVIGASELSATCTPAARRSPAAKASCCQRSAPIGDRDARPPADVGEFAVGQRAGAAGSTDLGHQLASVGIASQHHDCIVANVGFIAMHHFDDVIYGMAVSSDQFSDAGVTGDDTGSPYRPPRCSSAFTRERVELLASDPQVGVEASEKVAECRAAYVHSEGWGTALKSASAAVIE